MDNIYEYILNYSIVNSDVRKTNKKKKKQKNNAGYSCGNWKGYNGHRHGRRG